MWQINFFKICFGLPHTWHPEKTWEQSIGWSADTEAGRERTPIGNGVPDDGAYFLHVAVQPAVVLAPVVEWKEKSGTAWITAL